jgi:hypothetical protein
MAGDGTGQPARLPTVLRRQAKVTAVDAATNTCTIQLDLGATIPTDLPGIPYLSSYVPRVGDTVWADRLGGVDTLVVGGQTFPPAALADKANTQFWASTTSHSYTTSYQFVGGSERLVLDKRFAGTRLVGRLDLAFNNPNGAALTFHHALYCIDPVELDAEGQWEVCRVRAEAASGALASGARELGLAGRYPAGTLEFGIAGKASSANPLDTTTSHSWCISIREAWP